MFMLINELSSARIWHHKLCATFSANVNINYRLPIKVYYRICTLRHIRIEINYGSQNVFWVLTWIGRYNLILSLASGSGWNTNIRQPMLKLKTYYGFHDLFLKYQFVKKNLKTKILVWPSPSCLGLTLVTV
jgi:hypothetical protein